MRRSVDNVKYRAQTDCANSFCGLTWVTRIWKSGAFVEKKLACSALWNLSTHPFTRQAENLSRCIATRVLFQSAAFQCMLIILSADETIPTQIQCDWINITWLMNARQLVNPSSGARMVSLSRL